MESSFMLFGDSKSISQQPKRTKILFPLFVVWLKSRLLKNHMFLGPSGPSHPIHWIIWHRYLVNINRKKGTWWPEADVWSLGGITVHWALSEKGQNGGESVCTRKRVWPSFGLGGGTSVCGVDIQWFPDYNKRRFRYFVLTFIFKSTQQQHLHWFVVSPHIAGGRSRDPQQGSFIYFSWCSHLARYIVSSWRWLILSAAGSSRLLSSG